jgi:hypothetical protein
MDTKLGFDMQKYIKYLKSMDISPKVLHVLSLRGVTHLRRIEETVHGIVDSLLLSSVELFQGDKKILFRIIRKIFAISATSILEVAKYWKQFALYMIKRINAQDLPSLRRNPFKILTKISWIRNLNHTTLSKSSLSRVAHITSTRQLPAGDKYVLLRSMKSFETNLLEQYKYPYGLPLEILNSSKRLGKYLSRFVDLAKKDMHISLSSAASLFSSVAEGGRSTDIMDAVEPILRFVPSEQKEIKTPWGNLKDYPNIPRWRSWCRPSILITNIKGEYNPDWVRRPGVDEKEFPPYQYHKTYDFGEILPTHILGERNLVRQGFDSFLGEQIRACAYLEYEKWYGDIPMRISSVPEPGYKVRLVTITLWWVCILQQSLARFLQYLLKNHPFSVGGFTRSNQAWNFLYQTHKKQYPKGSVLLCSDLTEATDHIPPQLAYSILRGFFCRSRCCAPRPQFSS